MKISYTYILFSLFLAFLPGCELIHDDLPETRADGEPVYIRLQISTGGEMSATRANPNGGEDGNGREPGTDNENKITDVTLFLYDADVDINGEGSTQLIPLSFSGTDLTDSGDEPDRIEQIYTIEKEIYGLDQDSYHILAVANMTFTESDMPATLGDLRNKIITSALWTGTETLTNFVMSSEEQATISGIRGSSEEYPAEVEITIERLAAKVDYKVAQASFETTDKTGSVKILGAELVNDFKKGTLLFKRVGESVDASTFTYLGSETPVSGDATNWVVDAYATTEKQTSDYNTPYSSFVPSDNFPENASTTDFVLLGYTMENTNDVSSDELGKYATGVVFKAQYTPKGFTTEGSDFYYLNGTFYSSIKEIQDENLPGLEGLTETNYENYGIDFYDDGICYYTWWIRHSNNANANDDIMRYGIVRNNWYQLTVNSIKGLPSGDDDIVIIVAVEKWQPLNPEDLTLRK